ncbi:MAG: putative tau-tubulin kinase 2, partial [Streblomastix strix]
KRPCQFSIVSTLKFGIQGIEALSTLHRAGFVHRDIKPGNFVIGNCIETCGIFYLIDFGLCKKILTNEQELIEESKQGHFRGSLPYASLNAHYKRELSRSDDLMSLLYVLVELYIGTLPWIECEDREERT